MMPMVQVHEIKYTQLMLLIDQPNIYTHIMMLLDWVLESDAKSTAEFGAVESPQWTQDLFSVSYTLS